MDLDDKQLALWLSNHPQLKEAECRDDIHKLKGMFSCTVLYFKTPGPHKFFP